MAEGLGRTPGGVHMRLTELRRQGRYPSNVKYKTPARAHIRSESENYHYFTKEEDKTLCTLFGWFSLKSIAESLNRLEGSVVSRLRYLKRHGKLEGRDPYGYQKFRPWTEEEVRYLTRHYGRIKTEELAENLNRAITAVEKKASALNLRFRKRNYTAGEVAQLMGVRWEKVRRWFTKGLIDSFDSGNKSMHYYRFTYEALAGFVRNWPGFYDPAKITLAPLKGLANKVKDSGNEYLSVKQASASSQVPYYNLTYHLRQGNLPGLLILGTIKQRHWRIKKDDLVKWLDNKSFYRQSPLRKPTTILLFGEEEEIWPGRCTRNLKCQQCWIEGRLQCRPNPNQAR